MPDQPSTVDDQPLTADEFRFHMELIANTMRVLEWLPIAQLRNHVERAETLGPLLDPTAYMRGGATNLEDQRDMLTAAQGFVDALARIRKRHPELGPVPNAR